MLTKSLVNKISFEIIGCAIEVHKHLGPGLLESIYHQCLLFELLDKGFDVQSQLDVPLRYKSLKLSQSLRLDLLIENAIIVELKSVETIHPVYTAQLLSYMQLAQKPKGLLINFNTDNLSKSVVPLVNNIFKELPI